MARVAVRTTNVCTTTPIKPAQMAAPMESVSPVLQTAPTRSVVMTGVAEAAEVAIIYLQITA